MITKTFFIFFQQYPDQAILIVTLLILCLFNGSNIFKNYLLHNFVSAALLMAALSITFQFSDYPQFLGQLYVLFLLSMMFMQSLLLLMPSRLRENETEKKMFLIFWAIAGHLLITGENWMSFYLGLEFSTIPFYALAALSGHPLALEGTLKYFTVNACFSVLWLFSLTLVLSGQESFAYQAIVLEGYQGIIFIVTTALVLALKLGAFPCAYWAPDFYQVSSRTTIVWISFVPKYLMLAVLYHFFKNFTFSQSVLELLTIFTILGTLWGHFGAIFQSNVQRFLGYTAAAQIGFLMAPLLAHGADGVVTSIVYLFIYTLSLFAFLYGLKRSFLETVQRIIPSHRGDGGYILGYFLGLFSLAGFPPFPGFFAKLYVLQEILIKSEFIGLALFLALSTIIGLFYYMGWIFKTHAVFVETLPEMGVVTLK